MIRSSLMSYDESTLVFSWCSHLRTRCDNKKGNHNRKRPAWPARPAILHLINIWQKFNLGTDDLAVKPYIPHRSEFVANALCDNIGSKKISLHPQKIDEAFFSLKYQKFRVRVNHTITHNQCNQTQMHKVNYLDFCFVSKCLHISNSRTKPAGLAF